MAEKNRTTCPTCRLIRTALLCTLLGAAAGFITLWAGGSQTASMMATFFAAFLPLMVYFKRSHDD